MYLKVTYLLLFIGLSISLFGQDDAVVYELKDTVLVRNILEEVEQMYDSVRYDQALDKLDSLEAFLFEVVDEDHQMAGDFFYFKGLFLLELEQIESAENFLMKAFKVRENYSGQKFPKLVEVLKALGSVKRYQRKLYKAIEFSEKALEISIEYYGKQSLEVAKIYNNIGISYTSLRDYQNASQYLNKSLKIKEQFSSINQLSISTTLHNLGLVYFNLGEIDESLKCFRRTLETQKEFLPAYHPRILASYNALGVLHKRKGDYLRALEYYQEGLNSRLGANIPENSVLAKAYNNIGNTYRLMGDYALAIEYHLKAINVLTKIHGPDHLSLCVSYINIGLAFRRSGFYETALDYTNKALSIQLQTLNEDDPELGLTYQSLAHIYSEMGEPQKAIEYNEKALGVQEMNSGVDSITMAMVLQNLGVRYHEIGEYDRAIFYHQKALDTYNQNSLANKHHIGSMYNALGTNFLEKGNFKLADSLFIKALTSQGIAKKADLFMDNAFNAMDVQGKHAYLYLIWGERTGSFPLLKEAQSKFYFYEEIVQFIRENISNSSKTTLARETYSFYEKAIATDLLLMEEEDRKLPLDAFRYAEKTKSVSLIEELQKVNALHLAGIPDSLFQQEYDLQIDISYYDKKLYSAMANAKSETDSLVQNLQSRLFDLRRERDALIQTFETQYPNYYRLKYDTRVIDVTSVQEDLLTPEQTLVEYFVGDSSIYVFVIGKEQYEVREIKKDFPLEEWVENLRSSLSENYRVSIKDYAEKGHLLYQKLVAPVAELLTDDLIIIPDGVLGYIPFEALLTEPVTDPLKFKTYPYLLKDKQISYCYSATLLQQMIEKKHRQAPSKELVAFAPYYDGDTTLFANLFSPYSEERTRSEGLKPLPHTGEEVYGVSKLMNGEMFANQEATEERFVDLAGDYRIVHLATHGKANDKVGDYSFLAFTEIKDSLENELLYVRDLYNLRLNADMVVLSACETGIGELQRGEGIISLARGFTYAGAKSIFTTLWSVNDEQTKDLMLLFYKHLKKGMAKDKALRQAKLDFMKQLSSKNRNYAHPYFWSGMIGIGDMRGL